MPPKLSNPPNLATLTLLFQDKGDEDDYDDDDDVMAEGEEPVMRPAGRRQQVAAKKFEAPEGWAAPVYEKAPEEEEFLMTTMGSNKLMKNLAPSDREQLMKAFKKVTFDSGSEIITQGKEGDSFYVLYTGQCDISVAGKGTVMKATKGIAFGELALLHNAPRAATVTAEEAVEAYMLDEVSFKMILMGKAQKDDATYTGFIEQVPILQHLSPEDKQQMAGALKEQQFGAGVNIICEGDEGNTFYLIREGEVKCTKVGHSEEVSKRLKEGDFFGELALLKDDKRAATCTAVVPTKVLTLNRAAFTRLLGALEPPSYS